MSELAQELRARLLEASDPLKAPAMQAYMKSLMPFHGIDAPHLRRLCREVFDAHRLPDEESWRAAVLELWDEATHREQRYAAIQLTGHRFYRAFQRPRTLSLYGHLVTTGAWWDFVDTVASNRVGPILRSSPDDATAVIQRWAVDDDLWLRRTAILAQLGSKADTDTDLLRAVLEANLEDSLHGREFFIRKAVGWALRQHARTDAEWVRRFVADHEDRLSGLTRREALKHLGSTG